MQFQIKKIIIAAFPRCDVKGYGDAVDRWKRRGRKSGAEQLMIFLGDNTTNNKKIWKNKRREVKDNKIGEFLTFEATRFSPFTSAIVFVLI